MDTIGVSQSPMVTSLYCDVGDIVTIVRGAGVGVGVDVVRGEM